MLGARSNSKTGNIAKRTGTTRDKGTTHNTTHPAIQQGHRVNDKGDANTKTGDADIRRGVSNTAALHSPCHPPSTTAPHHPRWPHPPPRRGGSIQRIPHHTNSTDTHPHTTHMASNSARHDSSTDEYCNWMSRARAAPPHWGRTTAAHTTAIPRTEEDGHHPLIYSYSFTFTQQMITDDH